MKKRIVRQVGYLRELTSSSSSRTLFLTEAKLREDNFPMVFAVGMKHNSRRNDSLRVTCSCHDEAIWAEIRQADNLTAKADKHWDLTHMKYLLLVGIWETF
jgi:hypothetical protein